MNTLFNCVTTRKGRRQLITSLLLLFRWGLEFTVDGKTMTYLLPTIRNIRNTFIGDVISQLLRCNDELTLPYEPCNIPGKLNQCHSGRWRGFFWLRQTNSSFHEGLEKLDFCLRWRRISKPFKVTEWCKTQNCTLPKTFGTQRIKYNLSVPLTLGS